ncbi:hypothetical protein [Nocardia sp. NBC_01388]|uniref:hypothetical protein n=1 Tax=Nocardia sp. NBC_01388 TaxID=2903596 RepID=UPI0032494FD2
MADETLDAIHDHNEIRNAIAAVASVQVGTDDWYAAVAAANPANSDHMAEEERVLSEVCYYLDAPALHAALDELLGHLDPGGTVVGVHWRHPVPEYPLTGDEVHAVRGGHPGLTVLARYSDDDFLLEVYTTARIGHRSVAQDEGLV